MQRIGISLGDADVIAGIVGRIVVTLRTWTVIHNLIAATLSVKGGAGGLSDDEVFDKWARVGRRLMV